MYGVEVCAAAGDPVSGGVPAAAAAQASSPAIAFLLILIRPFRLIE
jgi:hypothetical protein